ncbi:hypothetical protein GGX14DRAFT_700595 [Mycena pura]|uniref:CipC-like antibiotic response protein n=1 Tax=Mycena pura TaxID=153505 RepID=A0AAD6UWQ2_9AGAR|nr:hypothetical protein GGX14DRAFT_700595 [Mycena pura]
MSPYLTHIPIDSMDHTLGRREAHRLRHLERHERHLERSAERHHRRDEDVLVPISVAMPMGGGPGMPMGGPVYGGPAPAMGGFGGFTPLNEAAAQKHYEELYMAEHPPHKASMTHELIAGAAGFAAVHAYEAHLRESGQEVSHGKMKEILAAIAAAEVTKLAETHGLDALDKHKAKKFAEEQAQRLAEERYGQGNSGWEYAMAAQGPAQAYNFGGGAPFGAQGCPSYGWYGQQPEYGARPPYGARLPYAVAGPQYGAPQTGPGL